MPIPQFDHNLVLPPHIGDPTDIQQLSPYPCTSLELCQNFGFSHERRVMLSKLLDFRERLTKEGVTTGFQWLDGSFVEDIETSAKRSPNDLDVVTIYWGYDMSFQSNLIVRFPEFGSPSLAKANYNLDHYPFDAGFSPPVTVDFCRYWALLFSHNRLGVWKGMLRIDLNTPLVDADARQELARLTT